MELRNSTEVAREVGALLTKVLAAILAVAAGVAVAVDQGITSPPRWVHIVAIAAPAALGVLATKLGVGKATEAIRSNVQPVATLPSLVSRSNLAAAAPNSGPAPTVAPAPDVVFPPPSGPSTSPTPPGSGALDFEEAAKVLAASAPVGRASSTSARKAPARKKA